MPCRRRARSSASSLRLRGRLSREQRQVLARRLRASARSPTAPTSSASPRRAARPTTCSGSARARACSTSTATSTARSTRSRREPCVLRAAGGAGRPGDAEPEPRVLLVPRPRLRRGGARRADGARAARARRALARARPPRRSTRSAARRGSTSARSFDFEYWPLELYKLTLAPPPPELAGTIVVVTGAASGHRPRGRARPRRAAARTSCSPTVDADGLAETARRRSASRVASPATSPSRAVVDELVARARSRLRRDRRASSSTPASRSTGDARRAAPRRSGAAASTST